jgi:serine/threonine protein kinase
LTDPADLLAGLVHRDINPGNLMMLDGTSELRIVDWSSCCRQAAPQTAVTTPGYSAPEQAVGRAVCASDWYSLGATCFALANGFTVDERGLDAVERGLAAIQLGSREFRGWDVVEYFRGLLRRDPLARPRPWESKRELFNIRRVSGPARSRSLTREGLLEDPRGFAPWISRMLDRVRGR